MIDRDIVLAKVAAIQRCLVRIKQVTDLDPERLNNQDAEDIFVLNLQRAVQTAIDLASHVLISEGYELPSTLREIFAVLEQHRLISPQSSQQMQKLGGGKAVPLSSLCDISFAHFTHTSFSTTMSCILWRYSMSTKTIDVGEMHPSLLDLLAQVAMGTEIILTEGHTPRARLIPFQSVTSQRVPGLHAGSMSMSADFDAPLPEDVWPDT